LEIGARLLLEPLEIIGIAIVVGFLSSKLFLKIKLPAVAAYVFIGVLIGPSFLNIFHENMLTGIAVVNDFALGVVAFMIGGELRWKNLKKIGKSVFSIVILEALFAFIIVTFSIEAMTHNLPLALILGAISAATAPAATVMVIQELRARGPFTQTLLAVVAIDDAIALIIFSFASAIARTLITKASRFNLSAVALHAGYEIGASVVVGVLVGVFVMFMIRKFNSKEDLFIIWLGSFFVLAGLAEQSDFSLLLACMSFGVFLINVAPTESMRILKTLNNQTPPLFIAFFVTAGAHLNFTLIYSIWKMALVYTIARIAGKIIGASIGATIGKAEASVKKYLGYGLISQVGVAIGLSLIVASKFSTYGWEGQYIANVVVHLLLSTTVITELIGPLLTQRALIKAGEVPTGASSKNEGDD